MNLVRGFKHTNMTVKNNWCGPPVRCAFTSGPQCRTAIAAALVEAKNRRVSDISIMTPKGRERAFFSHIES